MKKIIQPIAILVLSVALLAANVRHRESRTRLLLQLDQSIEQCNKAQANFDDAMQAFNELNRAFKSMEHTATNCVDYVKSLSKPK